MLIVNTSFFRVCKYVYPRVVEWLCSILSSSSFTHGHFLALQHLHTREKYFTPSKGSTAAEEPLPLPIQTIPLPLFKPSPSTSVCFTHLLSYPVFESSKWPASTIWILSLTQMYFFTNSSFFFLSLTKPLRKFLFTHFISPHFTPLAHVLISNLSYELRERKVNGKDGTL